MKTLNDHIEESLIKSYDTNKLISFELYGSAPNSKAKKEEILSDFL